MTGNDPSITRRSFGKWASGIGLASLFPDAVGAITQKQEKRDKQEFQRRGHAGPPEEDVHHRHILERPKIQKNVERAQAGNPKAVVGQRLSELMQKTRGRPEFDVLVRTVGEEITVTSKGPENRTINGWRPNDEEISALKEYGDAGYIPKFASTTVPLYGVSQNQLNEIARLPFVVNIERYDVSELRPPFARNGQNTETHDGSDHYSTWTADDNASEVRKIHGFNEADYEVPSWIRIGVCDSGYSRNLDTDYDAYYADSAGIWDSVANYFDPSWDDDRDNNHGNTVADTIAYMLGVQNFEGDRSIIPLRIQESGPDEDDPWEDKLRSAIEFAELYNIHALNISLGIHENDPYGDHEYHGICPNYFCDLLSSYTEAGYIPVASSGNGYDDTGRGAVSVPGCEWYTIGVGAADHDCDYSHVDSCDFERQSYSNFGEIYFDHSGRSIPWCPYCSTQTVWESSSISSNWIKKSFSPDIYAISNFDAGNGSAGGTSNATPCVAGVAALMIANGVGSYREAKDILQNVSQHSLNDPDAAQAGQLLYVPEVLEDL